MHVTTTRLADGRELLYYDAVPTAHDEVDTRELPTTVVASEARFDPLSGEWVVMASHRQDRTFQPPTDQCPLCPSTPQRATEVPAADYEVVVFENRFPSLSGTSLDPLGPVDGVELFPRRPGVGRCEVVCFSADHDAGFGQLSPERVRLVVDVWAERTAALNALPGVEQVFAFENRGTEIGVTLSHPHGQVYAYPFLTPRTERTLARARHHLDTTGRSLFADVLAAERSAGTRVVCANDTWTAFVPAAARWPVEVHLYPHRQLAELAEASDIERDDFATLYLDVLRRVDALYSSQIPYIAAWHQAPAHTGRDLAYTHLELFSIRRAPDKLKFLAGSESGMGVFVSDVTPESIADRLRAL